VLLVEALELAGCKDILGVWCWSGVQELILVIVLLGDLHSGWLFTKGAGYEAISSWRIALDRGWDCYVQQNVPVQ
jgi:hypothetical protein